MMSFAHSNWVFCHAQLGRGVLQVFLPPMEDVDLPPLDEFLAKVSTI